MCFDFIHPFSLSFSQIHTLPHTSMSFSSLFFKPTKTNFWSPDILGCVILNWSTSQGYSLGENLTFFLSLSSQQLFIALQVGMEFCVQLPSPCWGLVFLWPTKDLWILFTTTMSSHVHLPCCAQKTPSAYSRPPHLALRLFQIPLLQWSLCLWKKSPV